MSFDIEAFKAQAIASRSYVLYTLKGTSNKDYDVVNTVTNQVYVTDEVLKQKWGKNYDTYIDKLNTAINDTKGIYVSYNDDIALTLFFSTSTGKTENNKEIFGADLPYLQSVDSSFEKEVSPNYKIDYTFTKNDFCNKLNIACENININVLSTTSTGRILSININNTTFTGKDIMNNLGLKNNYFEISVSDKVYITTYGYGHGVGMSQYGALAMALNGYNYKQILNYYYKDTTLKTI